MVAHLVFQMAALDGEGPFGGSVFKNPARITKAPCRAGLPRIKNPPGVKERRVKKVGWKTTWKCTDWVGKQKRWRKDWNCNNTILAKEKGQKGNKVFACRWNFLVFSLSLTWVYLDRGKGTASHEGVNGHYVHPFLGHVTEQAKCFPFFLSASRVEVLQF